MPGHDGTDHLENPMMPSYTRHQGDQVADANLSRFKYGGPPPKHLDTCITEEQECGGGIHLGREQRTGGG